jgi:hypothetical protein
MSEVYNSAETFFVNPSLVQNAAEVCISAIEIYVKSKPNPVNNTSGIQNPGISVIITETNDQSVPIVDPSKAYTTGYIPYSEILSSSNASQPTKIRFNTPVPVKTNKVYAFVLKFDGGAEFVLWKNKNGEHLVGTTSITPGATGTNIGKYYDFVASSSQPGFNSNNYVQTDVYANNWRALNNANLKYKVYVARYAHNGVPVGANSDIANLAVEVISFKPNLTEVTFDDGEYMIPAQRMEYITYDQSVSVKESFVGGQYAYQNTFAWPGGYIGGNTAQRVSVLSGNTTVTANANFANGDAFNWANVFNSYAGEKYLVLKGTSEVCVRKVVEVLSNTTVRLEEPATFTNNISTFLLTPVGVVDQFSKSSPFGVSDSFLLLSNSSSNSTLRFVNSTIESVAITNGGTGYSNSDKIFIIGYETVAGIVDGGYKAVANLVTNSSGGITAVYFSNAGAGFVNTDAMLTTIANSTSSNTTSNTSVGADAEFTYTVGGTIKTELRANNNFRNINVCNLPLSDIVPFFGVHAPAGANYDLKLETRYYRSADANVLSGYAYYIDPDAANSLFDLTAFGRNLLDYDNVPVMLSRSNEFDTKYSNGSINDLLNINYSRAVTFHLSTTSNNDFTSVFINASPIALFSKYIVNNDYENEHTDRGNAWAKGLTNRVHLKDTAEDLLVYLTTYTPANTDIQVYGRLHNHQDEEAIDDKQWTRLEQIDGARYSSTTNTANWIERTYGLQAYPNVEYTLAGSVTVANNESNLIGVGTTFTSNLAVGNLIRFYSPLQPNVSIVAVVNTITNNTLLTINKPVLNNSFLGTTLAIDKIEFPHQGFNNIMNDNVARYYNSSMIEFDGYDSFQVKIIYLSEVPNRIPRVDDIKVQAVGA